MADNRLLNAFFLREDITILKTSAWTANADSPGRYATFMTDIEKLKEILYRQNWKESLNAAENLATMRSEESIAILVQALKSDDHFIRNAASLGIREAESNVASKALFDRVIELGAKEDIGTLVYSLETFDCSKYLVEILNLFLEGNYEVKVSTLAIIEEQTFILTHNQLQQVTKKLKREGATVEDLRIKYRIIDE